MLSALKSDTESELEEKIALVKACFGASSISEK